MRIQSSTQTRTRTQVVGGVPTDGVAEPVDRYQPGQSESPQVYSFQPLLSKPTETTAEKIAKIQDSLQREWEFFGGQAYDSDGRKVRQGYTEEQDEVYKRVGDFWREGTGFELDGRDREWPWSAAFISFVHQEAKVGAQFFRSPAHARYIRDAIIKKQEGVESAAYWGYRITERAPQVGDMVCYSRQKGVDYDRQPERYKSHADIVTAVRPGEVDVIGGNVGHSVSRRTLKTDENGVIVDQQRNWFAVLAPKDLSGMFIAPPPEPGAPKLPDFAG